MKKTGGVIGYGVLGKAYAKALGIDMYIDLVKSNVELEEMCERAKWILICVPTPPTKEGDCDTSNAEQWVKKIAEVGNDNVIVVRSTVIPGTAERLMKKHSVEIISAPEFLTESTAYEDAMEPDLKVIGSRKKELAEEFFEYLKSARNHDAYNPHLVITDNTTAEFIKYSINSFYATKVIFANEIYNTAQDMGVDYSAVMEAMYNRKWIGNNHLKVVHKGKRGYAGKCLPKDTLAFSRLTKSQLLELVSHINKGLVAGDDEKVWEQVLQGEDPANFKN